MSDSDDSRSASRDELATRAQEIFLELIDLPEAERPAALDRLAQGDEPLCHAVQRLLVSDARNASFLEPVGSSAEAEPLVGRTVDGFVIEERLAEGGMGVVYRARQARPSRSVALKVVRSALARADATARLEFESEVLSRLHHPNVAQVFAAGFVPTPLGPAPYFVMELVEDSQPITSYARSRSLGAQQCIDLFLAACAAVEHGHGRGVIHRDLKPSNVLVDHHGIVKVIDFGIARVVSDESMRHTLETQPSAVMGSLPYMAPEQCAGGAHAADARSDVYSLGAILYELLCYAPVLDVATKTLEAALRAVREEAPIDPRRHKSGIHRDLVAIVLHALAKSPDDRYQRVAALTGDLECYRTHQPIQASRPSVIRKLGLLVRRNPVAASFSLALGMTLFGASIVTTTLYLRERAAHDLAEARRAQAEARRTEAETVTDFIAEALGSSDPLRARGSEPTVRDLLDAAKESLSELNDQPIAGARLRQVIGDSYYHLGEHDVARELLEQSVALTREALGERTLEYADRAGTLAAIYWNQGRAQESEQLVRQALELRRTLQGPQHEDTLDILGALASVLSRQGRVGEAEPLLREIIGSYRSTHPEGHPVLARSLNSLGTIEVKRGNFDTAELLVKEAVAMVERHLGTAHPFACIAAMNYANVLQGLERNEEALAVLNETLQQLAKVYGDGHVLMAVCLEKQAISYAALGDEEAQQEAEAKANEVRDALAASRAAAQH